MIAPNSTFDDASCAANSMPPRLTFQAHSAPIDGKFDKGFANMYVSLVSTVPPAFLSALLTATSSTAPGTASPPRATRWSRSPLPVSTTAGTIRWRRATMSRGTRTFCGPKVRRRAHKTPVCDQRASCGIQIRRGCTLAVTGRWASFTCCTRAERGVRVSQDAVGSVAGVVTGAWEDYLTCLGSLTCFNSANVKKLASIYLAQTLK